MKKNKIQNQNGKDSQAKTKHWKIIQFRSSGEMLNYEPKGCTV